MWQSPKGSLGDGTKSLHRGMHQTQPEANLPYQNSEPRTLIEGVSKDEMAPNNEESNWKQ